MTERVGQVGLAIGTVISVWIVPGPEWARIDAPETRALYGFLLTLALLPLFRLHPRGARIEQLWFAVFLAAMPLIYLEAAWRAGTSLPLQLVGLAIYLPLAVAGATRWPWALVVGIGLHGLGWDSWHFHRGVVADWYTIGCAVIDLSLAGYTATRVAAWQGVAPLPTAVSTA